MGTTKPSTINPTIPTVVYDCAVYGHDYINGYCKICKEMEPGHVASTSSTTLTEGTTTAPTTDAPASTYPSAPDTNHTDNDNGGEFPWILLILAVFLVCVLGVMIVFLLKKKK